MTTIMEAMGLTGKRIAELQEELEMITEEGTNGGITGLFLQAAEGKPTNEILYLGALLRDYVRFITEK